MKPSPPRLKTQPNPWKQQSNRQIFENPWFRVEEDNVINPGGGLSHYGKILFKNIAIGIVPLDENNNTWLVGQYRYVPDCYSWEIPMGGGPLHINPLESAKRELREETGLSAASWETLMHLHTSNSVTDERGVVYVARELSQGATAFEETEDLRVMRLPLKEAVERVIAGEITDAVSVAALLRLALDASLSP
ncbi:MAG: NUDIX hydrolase [Gammaproteobacteria bacterium]|nr:NUDIX hydrolase [Gammaproteobacteria bacterium]